MQEGLKWFVKLTNLTSYWYEWNDLSDYQLTLQEANTNTHSSIIPQRVRPKIDRTLLDGKDKSHSSRTLIIQWVPHPDHFYNHNIQPFYHWSKNRIYIKIPLSPFKFFFFIFFFHFFLWFLPHMIDKFISEITTDYDFCCDYCKSN